MDRSYSNNSPLIRNRHRRYGFEKHLYYAKVVPTTTTTTMTTFLNRIVRMIVVSLVLILVQLPYLIVSQQETYNNNNNNNNNDDDRIVCNETKDCEKFYRKGTMCLKNGYCSNPFYNRGCFYTSSMNNYYNDTKLKLLLSETSKKYIRVCNSDDDPLEAERLGYCVSSSEWEYPEIRFHANSWDTSIFENWIVQILLSEILGVPTTVESGNRSKVLNFYDIDDRLDFGIGFDWYALHKSNEIKDCRIVQKQNTISEYTSCSHVNLEVWNTRLTPESLQKYDDVIEKPSPLGVLGMDGFYIPRFTALRDPTLLTYFGLSGEENRIKLANTFLRPTKWIDYCSEISTSNCTIPDTVAQRAPIDENEQEMMFLTNFYTGYFRNTSENDCTTYPSTCTGNVVDFPCGWASYTQQQMYHLNISLKSSGDGPYSGGYTYNQMIEIWDAANATKSNVMMLWWQPEALVQKYAGTDAEFQRVTLPLPTQECIDHRVAPEDRCKADFEKRVGTKEGACDKNVHPLSKVIVHSLYDLSHDPNVPVAMQSPGYDAVTNFEISNLQLSDLLDRWIRLIKANGSIKTPRLSREAVCSWVVQNYEDVIRTYIPRTYPRIKRPGNEVESSGTLYYVSFILAIVVFMLVVVVLAAVVKLRERRVLVVAQIEFLLLVLGGLILVQMGSIMLAIEATNATCISATWFINFGYTLELVPLIVKFGAIHRLRTASLRMKRVKIERRHLFCVVALLALVAAVYLTVWTIQDPPHQSMEYKLTDTVDDNGYTVVASYPYCQSNEIYWALIAFGWRSLLLVSATIMAVLTRNIPANVNESRTLGLMIYSQFSFLIWSLIVLLSFRLTSSSKSKAARYQSLINSMDVTAICCIYFIPKLFTSNESFTERINALGRASSYVRSPSVIGLFPLRDDSPSRLEGRRRSQTSLSPERSKTESRRASYTPFSGDRSYDENLYIDIIQVPKKDSPSEKEKKMLDDFEKLKKNGVARRRNSKVRFEEETVQKPLVDDDNCTVATI